MAHAAAAAAGARRSRQGRASGRSGLRPGFSPLNESAPRQTSQTSSGSETSSEPGRSFAEPRQRPATTGGTRGEVVALDFSKDSSAKSWANTKIKYTWQLMLDGEPHSVDFTNSRTSGKKRIFVDGRQLMEQTVLMAVNFHHSWKMGQHELSIEPASDSLLQVETAYELSIDGQVFDTYARRGQGGQAVPGRPAASGTSSQGTSGAPRNYSVRSDIMPPRAPMGQSVEEEDAELQRVLRISAAEERDRQLKARGVGGTGGEPRSTQRSVEVARAAQRAAGRTQEAPASPQRPSPISNATGQGATTVPVAQSAQHAWSADPMAMDLSEADLLEQSAILASLEAARTPAAGDTRGHRPSQPTQGEILAQSADARRNPRPSQPTQGEILAQFAGSGATRDKHKERHPRQGIPEYGGFNSVSLSKQKPANDVSSSWPGGAADGFGAAEFSDAWPGEGMIGAQGAQEDPWSSLTGNSSNKEPKTQDPWASIQPSQRKLEEPDSSSEGSQDASESSDASVPDYSAVDDSQGPVRTLSSPQTGSFWDAPSEQTSAFATAMAPATADPWGLDSSPTAVATPQGVADPWALGTSSASAPADPWGTVAATATPVVAAFAASPTASMTTSSPSASIQDPWSSPHAGQGGSAASLPWPSSGPEVTAQAKDPWGDTGPVTSQQFSETSKLPSVSWDQRRPIQQQSDPWGDLWSNATQHNEQPPSAASPSEATASSPWGSAAPSWPPNAATSASPTATGPAVAAKNAWPSATATAEKDAWLPEKSAPAATTTAAWPRSSSANDPWPPM